MPIVPKLSSRLVAVAVVLLLGPEASRAQLAVVRISPDVSIDYAGAAVHDEDVAIDDLAGAGFAGTFALGGLSPTADLNAFHLRDDGDALFSLDTTQLLPNGLVAEPRDVVRYDGAGYFLEFDGSSAGIANGVRVDAVTDGPAGMLLSFDTAVELAGVFVEDEDLVDVVGSAAFYGSAQGISQDLDLDGAQRLASGDLVLSFDGSGSVGALSFDDEDLVRLDAQSGTWSLAYDGSFQQSGWEGGDLDAVQAVPEPAHGLGLVAGAGLLAALARRRTSEHPRGDH